jgi:hypothetical protein
MLPIQAVVIIIITNLPIKPMGHSIARSSRIINAAGIGPTPLKCLGMVIIIISSRHGVMGAWKTPSAHGAAAGAHLDAERLCDSCIARLMCCWSNKCAVHQCSFTSGESISRAQQCVLSLRGQQLQLRFFLWFTWGSHKIPLPLESYATALT